MARYTREHLEVRVLTMAEVDRLTGAAVWLTGLDTHCYTLFMDRYIYTGSSVCMRERASMYIFGRKFYECQLYELLLWNFETNLVFTSYFSLVNVLWNCEVYVFLPSSISPSLSLFLPLSISISLPLSPSLSLSYSPSLPLSLPLPISLPPSLLLPLPLSLPCCSIHFLRLGSLPLAKNATLA